MDKQKIVENAKKIFSTASVTYYNATQFFPEEIRDDVTILYSFVRVADDFVDCNPQKPDEFYQFKQTYEKSLNSKTSSNNEIIDSFIDLLERKQIPKKVPEVFLKAMEQDLHKSNYQTLEELEEYMVGSAEVIGVMMAKIMELKKESEQTARLLGKAMQFINFIRDIEYDMHTLNRVYIPQEILSRYDFEEFTKDSIQSNIKKFTQMIRDMIQLYYEWQTRAETGFQFIPTPYLIPIKTASDMYKWTANKLFDDPTIILKERLKPSPTQILAAAQKNQELLNKV